MRRRLQEASIPHAFRTTKHQVFNQSERLPTFTLPRGRLVRRQSSAAQLRWWRGAMQHLDQHAATARCSHTKVMTLSAGTSHKHHPQFFHSFCSRRHEVYHTTCFQVETCQTVTAIRPMPRDPHSGFQVLEAEAHDRKCRLLGCCSGTQFELP